MSRSTGWLTTGLALLGLFAVPMAAADDAAVMEIREWEVPWADTRPRDPWYGPGDRVWFVGQQGHYVATLDPASGDFERIDLKDGAGPHTVIADERGAWYAGNRADHVGLIDPDSHEITRFELPGDGRRDPHTMAFTSTGDLWFTVQHGNQLGFLDGETREIRLIDVETPRARPYGLVVDDNDRPWFTLFGTHALATLDRDGEGIREILLPREEARPRRLDVGADGMIWYVDFAQGYLGRYDPGTEAIDEWLLPGGNGSGPYAMGVDGNGIVWAVETGSAPNRFVGFDPASESFLEPVEVPSGGGVIRHMVFHEGTNSFWFGTDVDTVGQATPR